MGTCSFTQRKYSHVPLLSQVLQKGSRQGYDWSMTGGRQIFIGSGHIGERPKQTQSCSRQVLESSSKVSYPHDLLFRCQKQNASKRWWDAALHRLYVHTHMSMSYFTVPTGPRISNRITLHCHHMADWSSAYPERFQSLKDVFLYVFHRFPRQSAQKLRRQTFVVRMRSSAARYSQTGLDNT